MKGMAMTGKTLSTLLLAALLPLAGRADDAPPAADVTVKKAAADDAEEAPALNQDSAKVAAMMAVAFDRLPGAIVEGNSAKVYWKPVGPFKRDGMKFGRLAVFFQLDGRTYAGVEFLPQEGGALEIRGYEFETPESDVSFAKVKVAERDSSSTNFIVFERSEIEADARKAIREILDGSKSP